VTTVQWDSEVRMDTEVFNMWANEGNKRAVAIRMPNGDVRFCVDDTGTGQRQVAFTLASYRADDLQKALVVDTQPSALEKKVDVLKEVIAEILLAWHRNDDAKFCEWMNETGFDLGTSVLR
jgi:hypothetical protein